MKSQAAALVALTAVLGAVLAAALGAFLAAALAAAAAVAALENNHLIYSIYSFLWEDWNLATDGSEFSVFVLVLVDFEHLKALGLLLVVLLFVVFPFSVFGKFQEISQSFSLKTFSIEQHKVLKKHKANECSDE